MIDVHIDDRQIVAMLRRLQESTGNLTPALKEIGEHLLESTKHRFETSTAPDGSLWDANSPVTLDKKRGSKPLIDSGTLMNYSINYDVIGDVLIVGSSSEYAAMQQFGGTKAEFPYLWGDIPARPFLGISAEDNDAIVQIIQDHLLL